MPPQDTGQTTGTTGTVGATGTRTVRPSTEPAPRPDAQGRVPVVDSDAMGGNENAPGDPEAPIVTAQGAPLNEFPYPGMPAAHVVWKGEKKRVGSQGTYVSLNVPNSEDDVVALDGLVDEETGDPRSPQHVGGQTYTFERNVPRRVHKDHVGFLREHPSLNFEVKDE